MAEASDEKFESSLPPMPLASSGEEEQDWAERWFGETGIITRNLGTIAIAGGVLSGLLAVRIGFTMGIKRSAMTQARLWGNPGAASEIEDTMFAGTKEQVASRTAVASRALKYGTVLAVSTFGFGIGLTAWGLNIRSLEDIRPTGERLMTGPRLAMHNSRLATWVREKREAAFPALTEDPTGLRAITEALRELDEEEQRDVQAWWQWLNTPTQGQIARMAEHSETEALEEEYAELVAKEASGGPPPQG